MLPDVDQTFLHNAEDLAAYPLRHVQILEISNKSRADPSLPLKTFDGIVENSE